MNSPPTGTVTFLFTDIEGSTKLWESLPGAMGPALARHDRLLREAITGSGGYVFKTVGDAFCAAFATAPEALAAAQGAQLALAREPWPAGAAIRARMALHTGSAEERGGDYFGPPLNRAARLMAAGHGGQTLLSEVTQGLVRDALPPGVALEDLGAHRLKDLGRPERVFQLLHPSLPAGFPPLRSLDNPGLPNNLPQQTTSFIGREKELAEVRALLARTRLLTLVGAGGAGKSRLSLQAAADLLTGEGDGVWLVELAPLADPGLVPQAVAGALGVREEAGRPLARTLADALRPKRLLLILDNCEHLVAACASLAAGLLRDCPGVHVLATSREPLGVAGEQTFRVPPLSLPDPKGAPTAESLSQYEAVRLFIERARAVQPSFTVSSANAPAVAQVCVHLDGIPLAIELAAARVRSLSAEEVNARLDNRFRLLTGGSRDRLPRQQTLRALVDWSYDLLNDQEKALLCRLSVFAGGWTLAAAEGVCAGEDIEDWEVLDLLTSLVDKSLAVYEEPGGAGRYRLLESIREYAGDRLRESGGADGAQEQAASWFLGLAEEAEPHLIGPEQASWLSRLEAEHDNLRAGLSRYERSVDGAEAGLRLAKALWQFWQVRGHFSEGRQWLDRALAPSAGWDSSDLLSLRAQGLHRAGSLASAQGGHASARSLFHDSLEVHRRIGDQQGVADALDGLTGVAYDQGDYKAAGSLRQECLDIQRRIGDRRGAAKSLGSLGNLSFYEGSPAAACAFMQEALEILRQIGDQRGVANLLNNLGVIANTQADYAAARVLYLESLEIRRQIGDQQGISRALNSLGVLADDQGDTAAALVFHQESLEIRRQIGDKWGIAISLGNLGNLSVARGEYADAHASYQESLTIRREIGDQQGITAILTGLGDLAAAQGDTLAAASLLRESLAVARHLENKQDIAISLRRLADVAHTQDWLERGVRLWSAAAALREQIAVPLTAQDQQKQEQANAAALAALGDAAFTSAWVAGQAMSLNEAVEYALTED